MSPIKMRETPIEKATETGESYSYGKSSHESIATPAQIMCRRDLLTARKFASIKTSLTPMVGNDGARPHQGNAQKKSDADTMEKLNKHSMRSVNDSLTAGSTITDQTPIQTVLSPEAGYISPEVIRRVVYTPNSKKPPEKTPRRDDGCDNEDEDASMGHLSVNVSPSLARSVGYSHTQDS
jgi:hypothetical protein